MRVIVTRPESAARRTAEKLVELGHDPVLLPLFEPARMPSMAAQALAGKPDALAVTSAEAVRTLAGLGPLDPDILDLPVFAVGAATAEALSAAGFRHVVIGTGDGAGLAAAVIAHDPARLLYLAGRPRSGQFEAALAKAGIVLKVAEIYDMKPVSHPVDQLQALLVDRRADVVLLYSKLNAESFVRLPVFDDSLEALARTLFVCISPAVAAALPETLQKRAIVALTPDEAAMLDLL